jgi:hypothetical protein
MFSTASTSGPVGGQLDRVRAAPADLHVLGGTGVIHRQRDVVRDRCALRLNPAEHAIDDVLLSADVASARGVIRSSMSSGSIATSFASCAAICVAYRTVLGGRPAPALRPPRLPRVI